MVNNMPSRRTVLAGTAVGGAALPLLAACGSSADTSGKSTDAGSGSTGSGNGSGSQALAKTSDIPVDGGKVFDEEKVVVTQPSKGDFKAFSAVCTHQGCLVATVSDGQIHCPCHGSVFSAKDGSVVTGPATRALAEEAITVKKGEITLS